MGIYDRDYTQAQNKGPSWGGEGGMRLGLPRLTRGVKWLLITNFAIFLVEAISGQMDKGHTDYFAEWGSVLPVSWGCIAQLWRLVTYQFLHANPMHIIMNMLALYFFGVMLEGVWGTRKFITYYLLCGAAAGLLYIAFVVTGIQRPGSLVGASGSIFGVLAACAILFPREIMLIGFLPLPMWLGALLYVGSFIFDLVTGAENAGGNVAHLGGMAAGAAYCWFGPRVSSAMTTRRRSAWDRKMDQQRRLQLEVDRILDKVHDKGLASLSRSEKKLLQEATRLEQERLKSGKP
jgi:membrane associated rhomboid family serine protease